MLSVAFIPQKMIKIKFLLFSLPFFSLVYLLFHLAVFVIIILVHGLFGVGGQRMYKMFKVIEGSSEGEVSFAAIFWDVTLSRNAPKNGCEGD